MVGGTTLFSDDGIDVGCAELLAIDGSNDGVCSGTGDDVAGSDCGASLRAFSRSSLLRSMIDLFVFAISFDVKRPFASRYTGIARTSRIFTSVYLTFSCQRFRFVFDGAAFYLRVFSALSLVSSLLRYGSPSSSRVD